MKAKVLSAKDHFYAAWIFLHGQDTNSSSLAVELMQKAVALDPAMDRWLLAAAIDRDLMYRNKPQIFGTQYVKSEEGWVLYTLDTTKVADQLRVDHGIKPLKDLRSEAEQLRNMRFVE